MNRLEEERFGHSRSDGLKDVTTLRLYTAAVAIELTQTAYMKYSPADAL